MSALARALAAALLLAGCSGSTPCQNLVHQGCDLDAGAACAAGGSCVPTGEAADPCVSGAAACCFAVCSASADCPSDESCVDSAAGKVCARGRCVP